MCYYVCHAMLCHAMLCYVMLCYVAFVCFCLRCLYQDSVVSVAEYSYRGECLSMSARRELRDLPCVLCTEKSCCSYELCFFDSSLPIYLTSHRRLWHLTTADFNRSLPTAMLKADLSFIQVSRSLTGQMFCAELLTASFCDICCLTEANC